MGDSAKNEQPDLPADPSPAPASPGFLVLEASSRLWVPGPSQTFETVSFKPIGTPVSAGEALTEADAGNEHLPVAPVAGHIVDTGEVMLSNGSKAPAVLLETDPQAPPAPDLGPVSIDAVAGMLSGIGPADLNASIDRLRAAGVWADRWTSPQLLGQLHACLRSPADIVLCSFLDADRAMAVNLACAREYPAEIIAAVAALARLTRASRAWLAVDADDFGDARFALQAVAAQVAGDLRFVPIENHYPQPDPTLLLQSLTGRGLRPGRMPTDQGVLLLDAAAALAVGRALVLGEPMLRVPLAVHDRSDPALADPAATTHMVSVAVGTPLREVLDRLGIGRASGPPRRHRLDFWAGAPLRDRKLTPDCIIAGGELGIFAAPREPSINPDPCIRCGWCVEGCPVDAHPAALLDAAQRADPARAESYGLDACIECGICSYVCPSHLPLLQAIRGLRSDRLRLTR